MLIPKTSSRAITSPAGTADTMEVLAQVELSPDKLHHIIRHQRGCISWGGTANLAPVDDVLISVERPLSIDSAGQMVASILSKKLAAGSTHLLLDIPVGATAKVRHMREALALRKLFEFVGDRLNIHLEVVITDGRQPVGRGIGPVLEARDVMQVLNNDPNAPDDLKQKSLRLAGRVLEFDPDVRGGQGYAIARDILESGRALAKMNDIIDSQGRQPEQPQPGQLTFEVQAEQDGTVIEINNFYMARMARFAGAPMDKGAGVDLLKKLGDKVKKGDALYRVHAEFKGDYDFARRLNSEHGSGYGIGNADQLPKAYVEF
jgi:thymidine phosphorylase